MKITVKLLLTSLCFASALAAKQLKISIANLGPHSTLEDIERGIEEYFKAKDLDVVIKKQHVNFDMSAISKMLALLAADKPDVLITLTTSVSQTAKSLLKNKGVKLVFAGVTDPYEAQLVSEEMTGVSDMQDVEGIVQFMKRLLPELERIGVPYSLGEANDRALLKAFVDAAKKHSVEIVPIPIENLADMRIRIQAAAPNVDCLYVGAGNLIQPALPSIVSVANKFKIPVFNLDSAAVRKHEAFASFAVSYIKLGQSAAEMAENRINDRKVCPVVYPSYKDHEAVVSRTVANRLGIGLAGELKDVQVVEK